MPRPALLFDVPELFLFGTPLAVVLLYRQMIPGNRYAIACSGLVPFLDSYH